MIILVLSSCFCCLIGGVSVFCPVLLILIFLSFSIIRSPFFSDVFLPTLSLRCETPDFSAFLPDCLANLFYNRRQNSANRFENIINNDPRPFVLIYKFTKHWMIKSLEFIWFHLLYYYVTLFYPFKK